MSSETKMKILTNSDKIKQMIECPQNYLINYFDEIKFEVDAHFEIKLNQIKDDNLRDETRKKWIKSIEVVNKCQAKCLNNKLNDDVVKEVKDSLEKPNKEAEMVKIKDNLEIQLLENTSCTVILIHLPKSDEQDSLRLI